MEKERMKTSEVIKHLSEGCRHLDPTGAERHVLDASLICTEACVAELWSAHAGVPMSRYCTHPFHEPELWLLTEWLKKWTGEAFHKAVGEAEDWLLNPAAEPLSPLCVELPAGTPRGKGYLWGKRGEIEQVGQVIRHCCPSNTSRRRVFWFLCHESDANQVENCAQIFLAALGQFDAVSSRSGKTLPSPSDDALRNALTVLRRGVQEDLQDELSDVPNPLFSVLFLKRVDGERPGMSFRFDSEQTEQLARLARDEDGARMVRIDPGIRDSILTHGPDGLAGSLEEVRYEQQFAGRVMRTCQAAKFEGWPSLPAEEFPREHEQDDPRLRLARDILIQEFLRENLYQIPLLFEDGGSSAHPRLADLIVVIAAERPLGDAWLRAQLVVRKHARFLQVASQLDQIRGDINYLDRGTTAHQQLGKIGRLYAALGDLADSSAWPTVGREYRRLLTEMEIDMKRLLRREVSAPRHLARLVSYAWERSARCWRSTPRLVAASLDRVRSEVAADLAPALGTALECVFENAIRASQPGSPWPNILEMGCSARAFFDSQPRPYIWAELTAAGFFDDHLVIAVIPDEAARGLLVFNCGPPPERPINTAAPTTEGSPLRLPPNHGLALNAKSLGVFGWGLDVYSTSAGLWWAHLYDSRGQTP